MYGSGACTHSESLTILQYWFSFKWMEEGNLDKRWGLFLSPFLLNIADITKFRWYDTITSSCQAVLHRIAAITCSNIKYEHKMSATILSCHLQQLFLKKNEGMSNYPCQYAINWTDSVSSSFPLWYIVHFYSFLFQQVCAVSICSQLDV